MRERVPDCKACIIIPLLTRKLVVFAFKRRTEDRGHSSKEMTLFQSLHAHLSHGRMMATRLRLERSQGTVARLQAMVLQAVVLSQKGRTIAANSLLEAMLEVFVARMHGRLVLADLAAQALFAETLAQAMSGTLNVL